MAHGIDDRVTRGMCAVVVWIAVAAGANAVAQVADSGALPAAVRLYEDASYREALQALDRLDPTSVEAGDRPLVQQYRALCFVALDRRTDATAALEALIAQFPEYAPGADLPPRVQRLFQETRARILPGVVRERYAAARAAYDAGDYGAALPLFESVIGSGEMGGQDLRDLALVARGFHDLTRARIQDGGPTQPALEVVEVRDLAIPVAPRAAAIDERVRSWAAQNAPVAPPGANAAGGEAAVPSVTPPVIIDQRLPPWPARVPLSGRWSGLLEIVIGPDGAVGQARLRRPVHPAYDQLLLAAARQWRYTPATRDGRPAAYVKELRIDVGKE